MSIRAHLIRAAKDLLALIQSRVAQNGGPDLGNIFRVEVADLLDQLSQLLVRQLPKKIDSCGSSGYFFRLQSEIDIFTEE